MKTENERNTKKTREYEKTETEDDNHKKYTGKTIEEALTKSGAKRIKYLIGQQRKKFRFWREKTKASFKEPIAMIIRNNRHVDFYEDVKATDFEITHSDGQTRRIFLGTGKLLDFEYGAHTFRGYIIDEDNAMPLPTEPAFESGVVTKAFDKAVHDSMKWRAKFEEITQSKWVMYAIAAVIIVAGLLWAYNKWWANPAAAATTTAESVRAASVIIRNGTGLP